MAAAGLSVAVVTSLTGCTWPDVSMSPGLTAPETTAARTSASAPTEDPAARLALRAAPRRPAGDLDTGSVTHALPAGERSVVLDYWTGEAATEWTAEGTKTLQVAAHLEHGESEQTVLVTRFLATADDGTTRTVVAEDRGEFALAPPFSYSTALSLTPSAVDATEITLYVQLELLVETEPGTDRYFRQTVLDRIVLPLLQEDVQ